MGICPTDDNYISKSAVYLEIRSYRYNFNFTHAITERLSLNIEGDIGDIKTR